jgi:hypothetical protein
MNQEIKIPLTSAEMGSLWTAYLNETMSICILKYFIKTVQDPEIRPVIEYGLQLAEEYTRKITSIMEAENFPKPHGFTEEDMNLQAPSLFTDVILINFMKSMAKIGLGTYTLSYALASRDDIRAFFRYCIETTTELDERAVRVLKSKGLYVRPPYITKPDQVRFVEKNTFLSGYLTKRRPVSAPEITHLFANMDTNSLGDILFTGFAQVAKSQDIREFLWRGKQICTEHKRILAEILQEDHLPAPTPWDSGVTTSTTAPFSDKLVMFMSSFFCASGLGNYGLSMAASPRHDIGAIYARLAGEIGKYANEGARIMIDNGWMEEPPLSENRESLVGV